MIKSLLLEGCSALIAMVLVVTDYRHITADRAEAVLSLSSQQSSDSRQLLEMDLRSRSAEPGTADSTGNDLVRQLSGLASLYSAGTGHLTYAGIGPRI